MGPSSFYSWCFSTVGVLGVCCPKRQTLPTRELRSQLPAVWPCAKLLNSRYSVFLPVVQLHRAVAWKAFKFWSFGGAVQSLVLIKCHQPIGWFSGCSTTMPNRPQVQNFGSGLKICLSIGAQTTPKCVTPIWEFCPNYARFRFGAFFTQKNLLFSGSFGWMLRKNSWDQLISRFSRP